MLTKVWTKELVNGKKTPIQERPDFPNLQNEQVTYFEAELEYPTNIPSTERLYCTLL